MAVKARATITLSRVNDGSDGVGIESTEITYQASESQTIIPTGVWVMEIPKLSPETPYLWTRTVIAYTDGETSTSYSVSSTIDGIEVAGVNLARGTAKMKIGEGGGVKGHWEGEFASNNPLQQISIEDSPVALIEKGIRLYSSAKQSHTGFYQKGTIHVKKDTLYTFSAWMRANKDNFEIGSYPWLWSDDGELGGDIDGGYVHKFIGTEWTYVTFTTTKKATRDYANANICWVRILPPPRDGDWIDICAIKLEEGDRATEWTPAPEDAGQELQDVEDTANKAENDATNALDQVAQARASLEILEDSISALVVDENGQSMMTQTGSGWTFNMGAIQSKLSETAKELTEVKGDMDSVSDLANKTNQLASDIAEKTAYINMSTDETGSPCMELGRSDSEFKLRITNTSIDFMQGSQRIAYVTNRQLYIQSSVVTDEMRIGFPDGFVWKKRSSGNMGLRWMDGRVTEHGWYW